MFVHAGLLHLLGNMLMLFVFGTAVESRMGSRTFILYYLLCGAGAAVFSLGLSGIMQVSPFVGASGAVLGVALAFAIYWPDAELVVFPIPVPIRARTLVTLLVGLDVFFYFLTPGDGIAHLAHVGGVAFGYLFFRLQGFSRRSPHPPPRAVERVVMVQSGAAEPERRTPVTPARPRRRAMPTPSPPKWTGCSTRSPRRASRASRPRNGASSTRWRSRRSRSIRGGTAERRHGGTAPERRRSAMCIPSGARDLRHGASDSSAARSALSRSNLPPFAVLAFRTLDSLPPLSYPVPC